MIRSRVGMLFVALAFAVTSATSSSAAVEPFEIDAIASRSGDYAFQGQQAIEGLQIVEDMTNKAGGIGGRPIHFVILDDQSNPATAVQDANAILAKHPALFVGPSAVSLCSAVAPLLSNGPVMYCVSPGIHPVPGSFVFSSGISTLDTLAASKTFFTNRRWTKVAFITSTDATGQDADRNIQSVFGDDKGPVAVVSHQRFNPSDLSVSAQMADIKASGAQVLVAWTTGTPFGTVLRNAHEAGLTIPILTTAANLSDAEMRAYAAFLPKELYFPGTPAFAPDVVPPGPVKNALDAYFAALKAAGVKPENGISLTWNAAVLMLGALRKLGLSATAPQIRDYLDGLRGDAGIYGPYDFVAVPQRGLGEGSVVMIRWDPATKGWIGMSGLGAAPLH
ncbi:MAG: ABC transporter substrate-binding protein [Candidatus Lustribacter sp.]